MLCTRWTTYLGLDHSLGIFWWPPTTSFTESPLWNSLEWSSTKWTFFHFWSDTTGSSPSPCTSLVIVLCFSRIVRAMFRVCLVCSLFGEEILSAAVFSVCLDPCGSSVCGHSVLSHHPEHVPGSHLVHPSHHDGHH